MTELCWIITTVREQFHLLNNYYSNPFELRFGKRSEVEGETGGSTPNDVIGPKDVQWLKYYLRSPMFSKMLSNNNNNNNDDINNKSNIQDLLKGIRNDEQTNNNEEKMSKNYF